MTAAEPLNNPRHERFANALVDHPRMTAQDAWALSGSADAPRTNKDSLKATAWRVKQRPEVAARIGWLRAEKRRRAADAASGALSADGLEALMLRLSSALTRVHERAEAENAPEGALLKLRRTLTTHAARQSVQLHALRLADGPDALGKSASPLLEEWGVRLHELACTCGERA